MTLLRIALRNLRRNRGRSAISMSAILVGVAAMVWGQGFVSGMLRGLTEDMVLTRIGAIQVHRQGYLDAERDLLGYDLPDDDAFRDRLRAVDGVRAVSPRIQFEGMISNGAVATLFVATAIDPASEYRVCPRRRSQVAAGSTPLDPGDASGVLIGSALADGLGAAHGATLVASSTGRNGLPNALDVTVHGLLPAGSVVENRAGAVVPMALAQPLLGMTGRVTEYAVDVADLDRAEAVAAALRRTLGEGYDVKTWRDWRTIRQFTQTMGVMVVIFAFFLAILVTSAIVNTMLMSVYERVREIGTMMAVGARRRQVIVLFLAESAALGLLGATGGAAAGLGLVRLASGGIHMPATTLAGALVIYPQVGVRFVGGAIALAVLLAVAAGLYPAWKASRLRPADALAAS
jgi:putative ABC transport system permease protein